MDVCGSPTLRGSAGHGHAIVKSLKHTFCKLCSPSRYRQQTVSMAMPLCAERANTIGQIVVMGFREIDWISSDNSQNGEHDRNMISAVIVLRFFGSGRDLLARSETNMTATVHRRGD
jgi:hypothetical protein